MPTIRALLFNLNQMLISISPAATLAEAAKLMDEHNIGALLVVSAANPNLPIGIITERDYLHSGADSGDPKKTYVGGKMTPIKEVYSITTDTTLRRCSELFRNHNIRHLPVIEEQRVIAIISQRDVSTALNEENERITLLYENYLNSPT